MGIVQRLLMVICAALVLIALPAINAVADGRDKGQKNSQDNDDAFRFTATLTGDQEVPVATSSANGRTIARFDKGFTQVNVRLRLRGINSMVAAAHFHCSRAGANGPVVFGLLNPGPLTEIGERTSVTLTNADFSGADCMTAIGRPVNNIAALYFAMRDGLIYLNVHTPDFPPGEVRGQMIEDD